MLRRYPAPSSIVDHLCDRHVLVDEFPFDSTGEEFLSRVNHARHSAQRLLDLRLAVPAGHARDAQLQGCHRASNKASFTPTTIYVMASRSAPTTQSPPIPAGLSRDQLLQVYRYLRLTRTLEERLTALYRQTKVVGGLFRSLGQAGE